jgi:NAD(P)-dependent dehydrogenase (short-subunit alcohol dehydrogenase family)
MVERGAGGAIVLISSTAGIKGIPNVGHYSAAKHGVVGLMKTLACELGRAAIRVNSVHPTAVLTPMIDHDASYAVFRPDLENPGRDEFGAVLKRIHLLPEPWVEARDIADAVVFLCSEEAKFITGQQLKVDLGFCEK